MIGTVELNYVSTDNCFLYLQTQLKTSIIGENDVVEVAFNRGRTAFFSSFPMNPVQKKSGNYVLLNGLYAKKLGIDESEKVFVRNIHKECPIASSITIKPISLDDWQIMELNLDSIQDTLLHQIKVFYIDQIFPIHIEAGNYVFAKTIDFEPKTTSKFIRITNMSKLIIEPFVDTARIEENLDTAKSKTFDSEWIGCFQVEFFDNKSNDQVDNLSCTKITTVQLINKSCVEPPNSRFHSDLKYFVTIEPVSSPMQLTKSNSSASTKKFLQSITNCYPDEYYSIQESSRLNKVFALMNVHDYSENLSIHEWISNRNNITIKMSNYLRQQLKLFDLFPKVLVKAKPISDSVYSSIYSTNVTKTIKLRTNYTKNANNVKQGFIKFIDQNSDCVCPIVLTNKSILEFEYEGDLITCAVDISFEYISISSNLLLNSLLKIEVEIIKDESFRLTPLEFLEPKLFQFNCLNSRWFQSNVNEIISSIEKNLINKGKFGGFNPRSIVLSGLKGTGKSTICKQICNLITKSPFYGTFHYVNCQNLMSKTADTIHDFLKFIYDECLWYESKLSLVVLENLDLLIQSKSQTIDPSAMLYYAQIIEAIKDLMNRNWSHPSCNVFTLVTLSCAFNEMPTIFHCLNEHGLFAEFIQIKSHSEKEETSEILKLLLEDYNFKLDNDCLRTLIDHTDGFVFKDFEKIIDKIVFHYWSNKRAISNENRSYNCCKEDLLELLYDYTCINMSETKFYKSSSQINWDLIGGLEKIKKSLTESLIWPVKYKNLYRKLGMKQSAGVLLYGPSGCGKTLLASALANESKFNFISVKGPELLSKFIGNSEQNVRELFRKAEKAKPCIIFFDEFDSLAPKRGHDSTGVTDRVVNQLLTQLDGVEQLDGVYLLGATSRPDLIDQALLRPGRLDNFYYIGYPDQDEIQKIFQIYTNGMNLEEDIDLRVLSGLCDDFTGADIKSVVCDAFLKAFHRFNDINPLKKEKNIKEKVMDIDQNLRSKIIINLSDMNESIETIRKSINKNERNRFKKLYANWANKDANEQIDRNKQRVTSA